MPEALVDRQFLEKLERLTLHWQKSFNGLVGGHNPSRFAGAGQEFLDHRNFYHGDDMRAVNWRAYLRLEKLFLKMFQIEPRVPVSLLLDASASMLSGTPPGAPAKFDYARKLAAALAYVGLVRLDNLLLQPFATNLFKPFACSGGRHRFQPAEKYLWDLRAEGTTDLKKTVREFLNTYAGRGLIVIVSDFLNDTDPFQPLQQLANFGHELFLIQIWSPEDRVPSMDGDWELIDAESGGQLKVNVTDRIRERYTGAFDAYAEQLRRLALRNKGRYLGLSTDTDVQEVLLGPSFTAAPARFSHVS